MVQDDSDTLIWGAEQIGEVIGRPARAAFYLLEQGLLPAKKIGGRWVASRRKLLEAVISETAGERPTSNDPSTERGGLA